MVLSHGRNFCLPPTNPTREGIFTEFEVLIAQLHHHRPQIFDTRPIQQK